jgi:iron complex transport system substrate-binding protein
VRIFIQAKLRPVAVATIFSLLCGAAICASERTALAPQAPPVYRQVADEIGRTIRIPQDIHRIVSLAPNLTETIYALGLQDRLVGDTDYCDFPPEAQQKSKVGGATDPSLEAIVALHPDLVLVTKNLNRLETVEALEEIGIPSYATDPHTMDDIVSSTERLADLLGAPAAGATVASGLQRTLFDLQRRLSSVTPTSVLFIVWPEPLMSVGKDTFIADALRHAGAVSIVNSSQNWPQVSLEEVVRRQPEFLIFVETHFGKAPRTGDALATLPGWRLLNAVREHRYATISDAINRPAPRLIATVRDLAQRLHPEVFATKPESHGGQRIGPRGASNTGDSAAITRWTSASPLGPPCAL